MILMDTYKKTGEVIQEYYNDIETQRQMIDLYPKKEYDVFSEEKNMLNDFVTAYGGKLQKANYLADFKEAVQEEFLVEALYNGLLKPVLESQYLGTSQQKFGKELIRKFVTEQGTNRLLRDFKYRNIYLSEMAYLVNKETESVLENCEKKCKEGLSEKDAYGIETGNINNLVLDVKETIPNDITSLIKNRVEDSLVDFVDNSKKNKAEINSIYDNANTKISMANGDEELQQEATAFAKRREYEILNRDCNLLEAMSELMLESAYTIEPLKKYYLNESGKVDFKRVLDDTKVMYSFLECLNTLNIIPVTEEYINNMLNDMKRELNEAATSNTSISTIDPKTMQEKSDEDDKDEDIDNKNLQNAIAPKNQLIK